LIEKYKRFLKEECNFENKDMNSYIIEKFSIDVRVALNKNIKNRQPQIWAKIVLGGEFNAGDEHIVNSEFGKYFYFAIQK
jgi:hypothetical protein